MWKIFGVKINEMETSNVAQSQYFVYERDCGTVKGDRNFVGLFTGKGGESPFEFVCCSNSYCSYCLYLLLKPPSTLRPTCNIFILHFSMQKSTNVTLDQSGIQTHKCSLPMGDANHYTTYASCQPCIQWLVYTVRVKKSSPPPLKLFAVFSLPVNLCNWKLPWLLPKHIPMSTPILVHLSGYLCEMYHFYWCDPSNFKNSI